MSKDRTAKKKGIYLICGVVIVVLIFLVGRSYRDSVIYKEKYEKAVSQQEQFLHYMKQDPQQVVYAKRDIEKRLQELARIESYATAHNITVTKEEIETYYRNELARSKKSEEAYLAQLREMYGVSKEDHFNQIREEILKQRVQESVHEPLVQWLLEQGK